MEDISTVLYLKALNWAGYSEDLKVAELERMLEEEGKLEQFKARAREELDGIDWIDVHNQPLVANQIAAKLATEFYPNLFKTSADFGDLTIHVNKPEVKRAEEMIDLIRRKSGKRNILLIIDEVGQYVSAKPSLILNLDGLAKNLKQIGGGAVWIFATAQQTLTDDNPTAAINSPGLYKLKDRFPIQINLEASDIKEICHKRLLTKSAQGEQQLGTLYDKFGASLRTATQLRDAGVYETELTKKLFVDLYPFLPAHFEILLQLLGRLAKKTGGLGLRSAIKVVQEVLIEQGLDKRPLVDQSVGQLANTVTFYDSLRRDIQSSFPHVVEGVQRVMDRLPDDHLAQDVAKSIAVLQILENLPVTVGNIAALMQPEVEASSIKDDVEKKVELLLKDPMIPLDEKYGSLRFLSQAAVTLQKQFDQIEYRQADIRAEINGVLRTVFTPLPSARIEQARPVKAGLRVVLGGGQSVALEGEKEPIQIHVEFVPVSAYDAVRVERENDSRSNRERAILYLLGRIHPDFDQLALTIVRCRKFLDAHRTTADPDTQEFIRIVESRQDKASSELERRITDALSSGSFVAHGGHEAVSGHSENLLDAVKSFLGDVAAKVFNQYGEAAHQADASLAEKFLTTPLDRITSKEDPLSLVTRAGGKPHIKTDYKGILSITDYLGQSGQVEGRRLLDHFGAPPYGWSKDTTRYLLAAAFIGGLIKLRIAGEDHQVKSDASLDAFKSNRAFGAVGISLREERPDPDVLLRASERLRDLTGDNIMPLEDEVAIAAKRHFPTYQSSYGSLAVELEKLGLPKECIDRAEGLMNSLTEVFRGDGSDAIGRLGGVESPLFDDLQWARALRKARNNGLFERLEYLGILRREINTLPGTGIPGKLKDDAAKVFAEVDDILSRSSFYEEGASLAKHSDSLDKLVHSAIESLIEQQVQLRKDRLYDWSNSRDWKDLDSETREWVAQQIDQFAVDVRRDVEGLRNIINHDYSLNQQLRELEVTIGERASAYRVKQKEKQERSQEDAAVQQQTLMLPEAIDSIGQIEDLMNQLSEQLDALKAGKRLRLTFQLVREKL